MQQNAVWYWKYFCLFNLEEKVEQTSGMFTEPSSVGVRLLGLYLTSGWKEAG